MATLISRADARAFLDTAFDDAAHVHAALRAQADALAALAERLAGVLGGGGQAFFCGNGGSAADAQHWAAELSGRFYFDRAPLAAHALPANISQLTAIGNDYGYDEVFARPLRGMARPGDVLVGISTSGTSANVLRAFEAGRALGTVNVGFCGARPDAMAALCDHVVSIPVRDTARVQEGHELAAHLVLALVERHVFGQG